MPDFSKYPLGAIPSPPDKRDYRVQSANYVIAADLPARYAVSHHQPVRNQAHEGTCVGHALASGVMGHLQQLKPTPDAPFGRTLSVRDAYEGARQVEHVSGEGAFPRAALKYAQKTGLCLEAEWPYQAGDRGAPAAAADTSRACNRIGSYAAVNLAIIDMKAAMTLHGALMVVVPVVDGFYQPNGAGFVRYEGGRHGYHAVVLVGWDDATKAFRVRNSWGTGWGQGGYCWLPYEYPITEAWSVTSALTAEPAPRPPPERPWWAWFLPWWQ